MDDRSDFGDYYPDGRDAHTPPQDVVKNWTQGLDKIKNFLTTIAGISKLDGENDPPIKHVDATNTIIEAAKKVEE